MQLKLLETSLDFIRQFGLIHLPDGYRQPPYIRVTHMSGVEDHITSSVGSFPYHFLSANDKPKDAKWLALKSELLLIKLPTWTTSYSQKDQNWGIAQSYESLYGATIIIAVGGLPRDQVEFYLHATAGFLHHNWLLYQGEN